MNLQLKIFVFSVCTLIFNFCEIGSSQNYFNLRYNVADSTTEDFSTSIIACSDGYIIYGQNSLINYSNITLLNINLFGVPQWIKTFGVPGKYYGVGQPKSLINTIDNEYALVGMVRTPYPGWVRDRGLLMKLSPNFDSLWTRSYGDVTEPCDSAFLFRQLKQLSNGNYIIVGGMMDQNAQLAKFYLLCTDSLGIRIWDNYIGTAPNQIEPFCVCPTSDHGYMLGGDQWVDNLQSVDPVVYKTDSLGNVEWKWSFGSELADGMAILGNTPDGNVIVGTTIADSAILPYHFYGKKYFAQISPNGSILWEHKFGGSYIDNFLMSIEVTSNGQIISTGTRDSFYPAVPYTVSWIFCMNTEGDSLWYREYYNLAGSQSYNWLYDVTTTNDNGFIACGLLYPASPDTGTGDTWVIKVDSLGCESPGNCWVGTDDHASQNFQVESGIKTYPNPATTVINIEFSPAIKFEDVDCIIYNLMGVEVFRNNKLRNNKITLDISGWPRGMYMARLVSMNESVGIARFLKE